MTELAETLRRLKRPFQKIDLVPVPQSAVVKQALRIGRKTRMRADLPSTHFLVVPLGHLKDGMSLQGTIVTQPIGGGRKMQKL